MVSLNASLTTVCRVLTFLAADDSGFALEDTLQYCHLEDDDATTIHTSSDSDESGDDATTIYTSSDSDKPEDDAEVQHGVRVRDDPERLPESWCEEAGRETPELEQPPQGKVIRLEQELSAYVDTVGANTSTKAHEAIINAGACCHAQSAAQQQDPEVPSVVCGIEFSRDPETLEFLYRRKVLERKGVKQDALRELIKETRVQAVFYSGNQVPYKHVQYMYEGSVPLAGDLEVIVTGVVWSDWIKCRECYKVDMASFKIYQELLTTGADDRID